MKTIVLLSISIFLFTSTFCQENSTSKKVKLKLYTSGNYYEEKIATEYESNNTINYVTTSNKNFDFGKISFAIELGQNKKFRHEIGLSDLTFKKDETKTTVQEMEITNVTAGEKTTNLGIAFRYQLNYYFLDEKFFNPFIGISSKLHTYYNKIQPLTPLNFPQNNTDIFVPLDLVLGAEFKISERLSFLVDIPFTFYQFWYERQKIDNPQLSEKYRTTSTINGESFPENYCFRIGAAYKL